MTAAFGSASTSISPEMMMMRCRMEEEESWSGLGAHGTASSWIEFNFPQIREEKKGNLKKYKSMVGHYVGNLIFEV